MRLAVDIGNSTISLAVMQRGRMLVRIGVEASSTKVQFIKECQLAVEALHIQFPEVDSAIVCSVVPDLSKKICGLIKRKYGFKPVLVGLDIEVPIKNNYDQKELVGQDRLVGAFAAASIYGSPCIIIDFGTAITIDFVSKLGEYEGGMIIPGMRLSARSLFEHTALLPALQQIEIPKNLIGKTTQESILSGIFYGYAAMCDGLIRQVKAKHARNAKVILTGGYTHLMKKFITAKIDAIDPNLIFKGLNKLM